MMMRSYEDAEAFRSSLDRRILTAARESGTPHDRLRKDVAFQRLVARFVAAGDERWAIKGGVAILWRVGSDASATKDVDANWMGNTTDLEAFLDGAVEQDLGDWFAFEVGAARPLHGEAEGALRFGVTARVAGREFASFRLDVNFTSELHSVERVSTHLSLLEFVHLADLDVPMISIAQQLAENLHAVVRTYSSGDSARAKDAFDTMLLAQTVGLPEAAALRKAVDRTFTIRATPIPVAPPTFPEIGSGRSELFWLTSRCQASEELMNSRLHGPTSGLRFWMAVAQTRQCGMLTPSLGANASGPLEARGLDPRLWPRRR
jgi:hypothetical protein